MRKAISKKLRFDVFKRDEFICQYCGSHPPDVVLHVDHIQPVAEGGLNDIDNLVTSCESCNLGKGARLLSAIPESLKEKAARIAESEAQIVGYQAVIMARRQRIDDNAWEVVYTMFPSRERISKDDFQSIKYFMGKLGLDEVLDAADIAASKGFHSQTRVFKYFCGICINKIRAEEE